MIPSDNDIANWKASFPGLDVERELQEITKYLARYDVDNDPAFSRRRFTINWLTRAHEKGGSPAPTNPSVAKDDMRHKLQETLKFFGKQLDPETFKVWQRAFRPYEPALVIRSLERYEEIGKFAPKPKDVLEILEELRGHQKSREPTHSGPKNPMDTELGKAVLWYELHVKLKDLPVYDTGREVEEVDAMIELLNREAKRIKQPELLLPEHRLPEYWGSV